jgi:hypothetical protein
MYVCSKMRRGRVGEQYEGECRDMSAKWTSACILHTGVYEAAIARSPPREPLPLYGRFRICAHFVTCNLCTYFSISFSFATSKLSSQPTSMRILMPPSNSSSDCDAAEADCAPSKGVKLNMATMFNWRYRHDQGSQSASRSCSFNVICLFVMGARWE